MQELLTPVQYEPALDMLNRINKLTISQKASLSLDAMQVSKNPVGHGNPIIGKFCKEDNNGALCVHEPVRKLTQVENFYKQLQVYPTWGSATFSQKVYGVLVQSWNRYPPGEYNFWCTPDRQMILELPFWDHFWLPFEGETIWFSAKSDSVRGRVELWGFY